MREKRFYIYILTNKPFSVFYVGVTSDLVKRIYEHKTKSVDGFTKKYNLTRLVYYEIVDSAEAAIAREKTLKRWPREWKINIIRQFNPDWEDQYDAVMV